jgi:hypothetical protein
MNLNLSITILYTQKSCTEILPVITAVLYKSKGTSMKQYKILKNSINVEGKLHYLSSLQCSTMQLRYRIGTGACLIFGTSVYSLESYIEHCLQRHPSENTAIQNSKLQNLEFQGRTGTWKINR